MGNVHALAHRVTALSMACLSSAGLILCAISGFSCSFLSITAQPDRNLMTPWGQEIVDQGGTTYFGVQCESPFYEETDRMWNLSQLFLMISLGLGGLTTALAWALSTFLSPNPCNWRAMSILAAITAVMEVPMFLLFESEACNMDITRQSCSLALGSYFSIASVVLWVIITLWTQFLDPPAWSSEENAWRTNKINVQDIEITVPSNDDTTGSMTYPPEIGPRDFNGELFVTSNDDGLAVWTMGSGHQEKNPKEKDDARSVVSSISDGEKDIESGPSGKKRIASSTSIVEASDDHDIHRGAAIVINKLREKTQSLRDSAKSYRLPSLAISTSCASPSKHKEEQTTDTKDMTDEFKERMREAAFMDSSNSEFTENQPGIKVTIICPDGSKEEAKFSTMPCFIDDGQLLEQADLASTHLVKQAKHASTPAKQEDPKPLIRSRVPKAKLVPEVPKRVSSIRGRESVPKAIAVSEVPMRVSSNLPRVPLSKVAVQAPTGTTEYSEDGVSEMTNGFSETTPRDADIGRDTLSILEDLARTY